MTHYLIILIFPVWMCDFDGITLHPQKEKANIFTSFKRIHYQFETMPLSLAIYHNN
jgi:hypothetical protein